ncbi:NADP-dependent isocitrate dehydrogenase [Alloscardovia macacae]|uniref:Isocitrate dehydrogenase [NADP] n=1 Tax=Alloscardovia macacae TaxID=1160091 RepID=A0A1Y2T0T8_9BIFI|nr:NADP-dependent isocitrate dehydrogenase [Alloscardovia macacae]OTA29395.1 NADP-dependent isocitrate dehydrogenase [Alloscardovia macacae]
MTKIRMTPDGTLSVPDTPEIPYIEGDGIGQDIWEASRRVFDAAVAATYPGTPEGEGQRRILWHRVLAGHAALAETGESLPAETLEAIREDLVAIKGPLETPVGQGMRSLNVALRQELDLYACVRPVRYFPGIESPLKHPELTDITIFRENTEDIYAGIEWNAGTPEVQRVIDFLQTRMGVTKIRFPHSSSIGIKPISREGSERLIRAAIDYALAHSLTNVTLVHKGNIQKFTEGGFRRWGYELAEREYADALADGRLAVSDVIADNFLQQILLHPDRFDVVALTNLNGDYASDALAAQVGGIGISPGANINYSSGHAVFEATHGTAPDIAGQGLANPSSLLLSGAMLLEYIGWSEAADRLRSALASAFASGQFTRDLAPSSSDALSTQDFADAVITHIR